MLELPHGKKLVQYYSYEIRPSEIGVMFTNLAKKTVEPSHPWNPRPILRPAQGCNIADFCRDAFGKTAGKLRLSHCQRFEARKAGFCHGRQPHHRFSWGLNVFFGWKYLENYGYVYIYICILYIYLSGWWFGTCFIFPYIGNNNPNWLIFFGRGWNHQPDIYI